MEIVGPLGCAPAGVMLGPLLTIVGPELLLTTVVPPLKVLVLPPADDFSFA